MAKEVIRYICQQCGGESLKWAGRCLQCGEWGTMVETKVSTKLKAQGSRLKAAKLLKLSEIKKRKLKRLATGIGEVDRVLGNGPPAGEAGLVAGSVVLLAGEPGIGKSTLLTQLLLNLGGVYVSGEESGEQVKMRVERLRIDKRKKEADFYILPETQIETIISAIQPFNHLAIVVIDSIQTMTTEDLTGTAGSIGQVRESANKLLKLAKSHNLPVILVGHVTKVGAIAGPKVLEHLVDTVLYLEGDREHDLRLLRVVKNRFGPTDEVGVFKMGETGMNEITDPLGIFLQDRAKNVPGSAVVPICSGNRVLLVEIQALTGATTAPYPRRLSTGIDRRRLELLTAVLQKRCRLPLYKDDVYLNVAGGVTVTEPGVDLGVCLAIISSVKNKPMPEGTAAIGEVGLLGEIRPVFQLEKRIKEARKLGFKNLITPKRHKMLWQVVKELWGI